MRAHTITSTKLALLLLLALGALGLVACEGGDDDEGPDTTEARLSRAQRIERTGNEWASLFAAGGRTCKLMTKPACLRMNCERGGVRAPSEPIRNCTPPSSEFRKSFEDATVEDIAITGDKAAARFTNGVAVELVWVNGHAAGSVWRIDGIGGNAGEVAFISKVSGAKLGVDVQAGVRFSLEGRQLTVSLFSWTPNETQNRIAGARIRATCGVAFAQVGPEGDPRNAREERTRLWPAGRDMLRFRFPSDVSKIARWCRVEDPAIGHVAFVKFGAAPVGPLSATQRIERTANAWARLFAVAATCNLYMNQPACEREGCWRLATGKIRNCAPPSSAYRKSFRDATVEDIVIKRDVAYGRFFKGDVAAARFSNGEAVELVRVTVSRWLISKFGENAGRKLFEN